LTYGIPVLARYYMNGSLNLNFGVGGRVMLTEAGWTWGQGMAIDADNKILITGEGGGNVFIARLNSDGSYDTSFGGGAGFILDPGLYYGHDASAIAVQADGKIVVAGWDYQPLPYYQSGLVARYLPDGTPDVTFGNGGYSTVSGGDPTQLKTFFEYLTIQADGKILATGYTVDSETGCGVVAARFLLDGSLDPNF
jgi:uncharacterized delta-60 repeat protein